MIQFKRTDGVIHVHLQHDYHLSRNQFYIFNYLLHDDYGTQTSLCNTVAVMSLNIYLLKISTVAFEVSKHIYDQI